MRDKVVVNYLGALLVLVFGILGARTVVQSQTSQASQVVAVRAGRLFDSKAGVNLTNQVVIIRGDRIAAVGAAGHVQIPAGARVIDLSQSTVLPGLIDGHVHLTAANGNEQQAKEMATASLNAGFTTLVAMGSHGGAYADVELKRDIDSGQVQGPRILPAGPIVGVELPAKGPEAYRAGVRQNHEHGADHVKIMTTGSFEFKPDGTMVVEARMTRDEIIATVDEAHKLGMWVASHTYGGDGLKWAIEAGVDDIQHAMGADEADIKALLSKKLPIGSTILDQRQDEPGDLKKSAPYSRWRQQEKSSKKMIAAGIKYGFSSGAAPVVNGQGRIYNQACQCSHGVQGEMFPVFVSWGATPAYALRMAMTVNAENLRIQNSVGSIEKGKFADLIAVAGDPLRDITEMQRVKFVMKGGQVIKNELTTLFHSQEFFVRR